MGKLNTLEKGLEIVLLLGRSSANIPGMASDLNLPISTVYRYINVLRSKGFVEEDTRTGYYRLGFTILELSKLLREKLNITHIALPVMRQLREQTEETVLLLSRHGNKVICIEALESDHLLRFTSKQGRTMFMHAGASAKVIMAHLDEAEQDRIIREEGLPRFTENTITDPARLREELAFIRKHGVATTTAELDPGARGIATPILSRHGKLLAALSITGPLDRITNSKVERFSKLAVGAAKKIAEQIDKIGILF